MARYAYELLLALVAIVLITILYAVLTWDGIPGPGSFVGHTLGIVGFLLMLAAETLYTLRKRLRGFQYGPTGLWLRVHVFMGIVGPYLVLLHSAGKFHGLAGVLTFATIVIVLSGFVGRYIYTATPRDLDGVEVGVADLQLQIVHSDQRLRSIGGRLGKAAKLILDAEPAEHGWFVVLARPFLRWRQHRHVHAELAKLSGEDRAQVDQLEGLLDEHYRLMLQIHSLAATRKLLALWHVFHVPLGGVLFTLVLRRRLVFG
jgi:xanthosine utilization system XapX-like protein